MSLIDRATNYFKMTFRAKEEKMDVPEISVSGASLQVFRDSTMLRGPGGASGKMGPARTLNKDNLNELQVE